MKNIIKYLATGFVLILAYQTNVAYAAKSVCVSNGTLPKHCNTGDIIVVRAKHVATTCDFSQQIIELHPSKTAVEFLCSYTGEILKIKPNTSKPPQPPMQYQQQPRKKKKTFFW